MRWRPRSLFGSTALTLGVALLLFQVLAPGTLAWNLTYPMARNAADGLAALIVLSARTWVELPPQTRPAFEHEMTAEHGLSLRASAEPLPDTRSYLPYRYLLESALARAAAQVDAGSTPEPVPEQGPDELAQLAHRSTPWPATYANYWPTALCSWPVSRTTCARPCSAWTWRSKCCRRWQWPRPGGRPPTGPGQQLAGGPAPAPRGRH